MIYIICILGFLLAGIFGYCITRIFFTKRQLKTSKDKMKAIAGVVEDIESSFACDGLSNKILTFMVKLTYFSENRLFVKKKFLKRKSLKPKIENLRIMCHLSDDFDNQYFREVQFRLITVISICSLILGLIFSVTLSIILFITGVILGFYLPVWAMKNEVKARTAELERNLPEMLEVVSLGLRSGLTFDRSFKIYTEHFTNVFSDACSLALKKWEGGIKSREDSLKELSNSYDSFLFKRIVDNIIRSLRFGSSLVESLEEAAVESRTIYKANQEEKVAKAPVKMMIPTGTLILPAMLLLVMGPILLNLIGGF